MVYTLVPYNDPIMSHQATKRTHGSTMFHTPRELIKTTYEYHTAKTNLWLQIWITDFCNNDAQQKQHFSTLSRRDIFNEINVLHNETTKDLVNATNIMVPRIREQIKQIFRLQDIEFRLFYLKETYESIQIDDHTDRLNKVYLDVWTQDEHNKNAKSVLISWQKEIDATKPKIVEILEKLKNNYEGIKSLEYVFILSFKQRFRQLSVLTACLNMINIEEKYWSDNNKNLQPTPKQKS